MTPFQEKICNRYLQHKRALPRRDTFDQYKVLVSETMLQQTQVDRVIPKYNAFIDIFPSLEHLADAPKELLLFARSGLGFNNRVLRLQATARAILEKHNGVLPRERETLMMLPGIGPYTSCALLAFTYNLSVPVIDTNIRRIYLHELQLPEQISTQALEKIALDCIPVGQSNDRHNALMDYGSLIITSKKTGIKPLSKQSRFAGSRRQVRGNVLKYLLTHGPTAITVLEKLYSHDHFVEIIDQMIVEQLIQKDRHLLAIGE